VQVTETVHGLVLAGGQSRRMGRDKALMKMHGESQLGHAVSLLREALPEVYVSARPEQQNEPVRRRFPLIVDQYSGLGPVAGILSALESRNAAWLVVACDLPNLDSITIDYLLEHRSASHPFTAYRSSVDDLPEPLCAIYEPAALPLIKAFVAEGLHCPRKMLIRSDTCLLKQPNPRALENVNTPEDLTRAVGGLTI
jgi:molybdopterin-guanine dinucleotide biosynthesis protein A